MINYNKKQSASANKKEVICKSYQLEFNYKNQRKIKKKLQTVSFTSSNAPEEHHQERWTMPTQILQSQREQYKRSKLSIAPNRSVNPKLKLKNIGRDETFITQDFPQRKVKTNEHQLFKFLSKLQDNQSKRVKTEHLHLENRSFSCSKNHQVHSTFKPHLKFKMSPKWIKSRYCINRDKDNGIFPKQERPSRGSLDRMGSIVVKNPFRR